MSRLRPLHLLLILYWVALAALCAWQAEKDKQDRQRRCYEQQSAHYREAERRFGPDRIRVDFDPNGGYWDEIPGEQPAWRSLPWIVELPSYPAPDAATGATLDEAVAEALQLADEDREDWVYEQHLLEQSCGQERGCR